MLAGNEQNVTEAGFQKIASFGYDFLNTEGDPQNRIVAREPAIAAIVDAFVRQIKRSKQPHCPAEMLKGERSRTLRHCFKLRIGLGCDELFESAHHRRLAQSKVIERCNKRHRSNFALQLSFANGRSDRSRFLSEKQNAGTLARSGVQITLF